MRCQQGVAPRAGTNGCTYVQVAMWVKGLQSSPADLFEGRRRRSRITVQGKFKQALSFDDVRSHSISPEPC